MLEKRKFSRLFAGTIVLVSIVIFGLALSGKFSKLWESIRSLELKDSIYSSFSPDGKWIVTSNNGVSGNKTFPGLIVWDADNGEKILELDIGTTLDETIFHPTKPLLIVETSVGLNVWNTTDWFKEQEISLTGLTCDIDLSPQGDALIRATCGPGNNTLFMFDTTSWEGGEAIFNFEGGGLSYAKYSPLGRLVVIGYAVDDNYSVLYLVDVASLTIVKTLEQPFVVTALEWTSDGKSIVAASKGGEVYLWQIESNHFVEYATEMTNISSLDINYQEDLIALGGNEGIALYRLHDWLMLKSYETAPVRSVRFSNDGKRIITSSLADETQVFEVSN